MSEDLRVSAYGVSIPGESQNLDNIYINGRYLTTTSDDDRTVISKVMHADFQVYAVCDGQAAAAEESEEEVYPAAVVMNRLQRLQSAMAEENKIDMGRIWEFLCESNKKLKEYKESTGAEQAAASFAGLFLQGNRGLAVHLGDSSIYVVRGGRMLQITEDHLLSMDMYRYGILTKQQAEIHKKDSGLTAYLGMDDIYEAEDMVFSKFFVFYPDDIFIIASDGVTDYISNEELETLMRSFRNPAPEEIAQVLLEKIGKVSQDDKSIVVLRVDDAPGGTAPQRGSGTIPQRENFDSREQDQPQTVQTDTTKLSSIAQDIEREERVQNPDDYGDDEDYDDEDMSIVDKILSNPKRLAIVLGCALLFIIAIVMLFGGSGSGSSSGEQDAEESSAAAEESSVEESSEEESSETSEEEESSEESSEDSTEEDSTDESAEDSTDETTDTDSSTYTVVSGDTLYSILVSYYGSYSSDLATAVADYNGIDASTLSIGTELVLPTLEELGLE